MSKPIPGWIIFGLTQMALLSFAFVLSMIALDAVWPRGTLLVHDIGNGSIHQWHPVVASLVCPSGVVYGPLWDWSRAEELCRKGSQQ